MNETLISNETTVAELLELHPQMAKVFIQHKTACIGCFLARFCTLKDVAATYSFDEAEILVEFHRVLNTEISTLKRSNA